MGNIKEVFLIIRRKLGDIRYRAITEMKWRAQGKPVPPPHFIKQRIIKDYANKFGIKTFVETGTYNGSTTTSVKKTFDEIYSIELDRALFERAQNKFSIFPHIHILQGDSSKVLPMVLSNIDSPVLFWLDGHYSGGATAKGDLETPILEELKSILNHQIKNHVILIDDARLFIGKNDYPTTVELRSFVNKINPKLNFEISEDIIRIMNL